VDDALRLIVVEVNVVFQRASVLGPHDLHALSGQTLELLELALVKLESSDAVKLIRSLVTLHRRTPPVGGSRSD
jgi:hypothetical protein